MKEIAHQTMSWYNLKILEIRKSEKFPIKISKSNPSCLCQQSLW